MSDQEIRLLVVEDDHALRDEITRVLQRRTGHIFETAANAEEAISLFTTSPFDLVITDVRMPGMSGIDMLEELKKIEPDLVSVIITAFADEQATIKALKLGANDYIRKPFSIRDLLAAIQRQITIINLRRKSDKQRVFLEGMVSNLVSGVLAVDVEGTIVACNSKAADVLGIDTATTEDINTIDEIEQMDTPGAGAVTALLEELHSSGASSLERDHNAMHSGLEIPYRLSAFLLKDERNRQLGTVVLFSDISTVVQQQRLTAWKDLARTVAHEIKNPLTPIILGAQQLLSARQRDDPGLLKQFDLAMTNILKNAERLDNLAREFSRFGRLPGNRRNPVNLSECVNSSLATFQERLARLNIQVHKEFDAGHSTINGDAEGLLRMLENLIDNSLDAMPAGGELTVGLRNEKEGWVTLRVSDTGEGIDPELRETLFKPYITTKEHGTGLGLVIVREVVDRHDGIIDVHENERGGALFSIEFPLHLRDGQESN